MNTVVVVVAYRDSDLQLNLDTKDDDDLLDFDSLLRSSWSQKEEIQGLFRYVLPKPRIPFKVPEGKYRFVLQLNPDRGSKRRPPQEITNMREPFNPEGFHFNKVKEEEILLRLDPSWSLKGEEHVCLINVSPLEFGHILIVPSRKGLRPQGVTYEGLRLAVEVVLLNKDRNFRSGFNSLCGFASVNHEHYHAYYLDHRLYLETAVLQPITPSVYRIEDYPAQGFVFLLQSQDSDTDMEVWIRKVLKFTNYMTEQNLAHNIFITRGGSKSDHLRLYLWAREPAIGAKDGLGFNPALCELGGHFPCKNETTYSTMTQVSISSILQDLTTKQYSLVLNAVLNGKIL